eukprot:GHVT01079526.1.p1 GENE.GHVT01079526.1~~GHVT01079526.1.p1  ORF type:complete len:636 (-),score=145.66 GHVT01079526.1:808-2715(-)
MSRGGKGAVAESLRAPLLLSSREGVDPLGPGGAVSSRAPCTPLDFAPAGGGPAPATAARGSGGPSGSQTAPVYVPSEAPTSGAHSRGSSSGRADTPRATGHHHHHEGARHHSSANSAPGAATAYDQTATPSVQLSSRRQKIGQPHADAPKPAESEQQQDRRDGHGSAHPHHNHLHKHHHPPRKTPCIAEKPAQTAASCCTSSTPTATQKKQPTAKPNDQAAATTLTGAAAAHALSKSQQRAKNRLTAACLICLIFMLVEITAGYLANSLALVTDAAHLLSDVSSFGISLFAIWVSNLEGNPVMSFGYHRAEILSALLSVLLIWALALGLIYEGTRRLFHPMPVHGRIMFITAAMGTVANVGMAMILGLHTHGGIDGVHATGSCCGSKRKCCPEEEGEKPAAAELEAGLSPRFSCSSSSASSAAVPSSSSHQSGFATPAASAAPPCSAVAVPPAVPSETSASEGTAGSMSLRAAYIHAIGDLLQNIGVMIAAAIIWYRPELSIVDPICTVVFGIFVLFTTTSIIREALNVLMEGTPVSIDLASLEADLLAIPDVVELHDLHVWSISVGKPALACHIVVGREEMARRVLRSATETCQIKYNILHTTIQTDYSSNKASCDTFVHARCYAVPGALAQSE